MKLSRRIFVAVGAASLAVGRYSLAADTKERLPLAFSTLGCPAWEWQKILQFAESHGFAAIEIRGLMGSLDGRNLPQTASRKRRRKSQPTG